MPIILQISAGQGPEECKKFVALLAKIICDNAETSGINYQILTPFPPKNSNIASMRFTIEGKNTEQFRKHWEGTVKWIWQSTIRPNWQRKNWFVKVTFFNFDTRESADFKLSDLKIECFRASGNGGQHVNTTDSAVRVIHLPSGIEASASEERSQIRNKELAILRLQEKLHLIGEQKLAAEKESMWLDHYQLERGGEIRTFKGLPPKEIISQ